MLSITTLIAIGGKEWKSDDGKLHRVYFNVGDFSALIDVSLVDGNLAIGGRRLSNNKSASLASAMNQSKVWYDVADGKLYAQGFSHNWLDTEARQVIWDDIKERAAEYGSARVAAVEEAPASTAIVETESTVEAGAAPAAPKAFTPWPPAGPATCYHCKRELSRYEAMSGSLGTLCVDCYDHVESTL